MELDKLETLMEFHEDIRVYLPLPPETKLRRQGIFYFPGVAVWETGLMVKLRPSCLNIFRSVLRFGVDFPDSILATEECGSPHSSARSL